MINYYSSPNIGSQIIKHYHYSTNYVILRNLNCAFVLLSLFGVSAK